MAQTYRHPQLSGALAATVIQGFVRVLQVSLCPHALVCMARQAESCIAHARPTVRAVRALPGAAGGALRRATPHATLGSPARRPRWPLPSCPHLLAGGVREGIQ